MKSIKKIIDPTIAKQTYKISRKEVKNKVSYEKWVVFIESEKDYFTWQEDTKKGKETLANINLIPSSFRENILKTHNKKRAFAEYNKRKGYHEVNIDYIEKYGTISTTFQKPITKEHLRVLFKMANYLDALLLVNGTKIITQEDIESGKVV